MRRSVVPADGTEEENTAWFGKWRLHRDIKESVTSNPEQERRKKKAVAALKAKIHAQAVDFKVRAKSLTLS